MSLKPSDSQLTLVNSTNDNKPALVLLLTPDNVNQTTITPLGSTEVVYRVESNISLTKSSVFRPSKDESRIALIERSDFFPDKITLIGEERQLMKTWLKGYGAHKPFPISFEKFGQFYHWRKSIMDQLALFNASDAEHPIAWFERSKKRIVDGIPVILQAWIALQPDAIAMQDEVIISFLVVEHKLRMDVKAREIAITSSKALQGQGAAVVYGWHAFKVDRIKLEKLGYSSNDEDPENTRFYRPVIDLIPTVSYKYIGAGFEEDGDMCLVVVMEDGWDKEELEKMEMPNYEGILARAVESVLTPGVWRTWDE